MQHTYFITGFPGFIATKLVHALREMYPEATFYLLVLNTEMELAKEILRSQDDRIQLVEGDITKNNLGISKAIKIILTDKITHCVHLAALYDLTIPFAPAYSCNVDGTEHIINLVKECKEIRRFCYFSTAYVSGYEKGTIYENCLIEPERFRNHYEQTKYLAEQKVQAVNNELPITIIRPGIIVGDSLTGETIKFDGPYFMMKFLRRLSFFPIPYIGKSYSTIHIVPVDFIIKSSIFLMHENRGESKTYHLLCPNSPSVQDAYTLICKELNNKMPSWYVPRELASFFLSFSFISKWLGVPKEILSYFTHEAHYDTTQLVKDLDGSGIEFPQYTEFIKPVVHYFKENAENRVFTKY